MPNLYATPTEIKASVLHEYDTDISDFTAHDNLYYRLSERISRMIDRHTQRTFYPWTRTAKFEGSGDSDQWISDLFSATTVSVGTGSYDSDGAIMDSDFASTDYLLYFGNDDAPLSTYNRLVLDPNGLMGTFPEGLEQVQIDGVWCFHNSRADAWENSMDTVQDNPLSSSATSITVSDADGTDQWGITPRFQIGQLIRIESEYCEITNVDASTDALTVVRGRNGSTAASHVQNTQIDIWQPDPIVKEVCIIECVRLLMRGLDGFGDARANPELGTIIRVASLDPVAQAMLEPFRRRTVVG